MTIAGGACIGSRMKAQPQMRVYGMHYSTAKRFSWSRIHDYCRLGQGNVKCIQHGWSHKYLSCSWSAHIQYSLGNLVVDKDRSKIHYQLMGLQNPKWVEPGMMWTFGEAGVSIHCKNESRWPGSMDGVCGICQWPFPWQLPDVKPSLLQGNWALWHYMVAAYVLSGWQHCRWPCYQRYAWMHKFLQDMIASMKHEGPNKCKPGRVDPVNDETELELVTHDDGDDNLLGLKVDS